MADFPLDTVLDFLQCLWRLNHAVERLSGRMDRRLGVTAQQRFVLRCVGRFPGLTAGHLATLLHLDPGTVSATLRRLEAKHMLERRRDPADNRRVTLGLTHKGRSIDATTEGTVEGAVQALLESSSTAEVRRAVAVIGRLTTLLSERTGDDLDDGV